MLSMAVCECRAGHIWPLTIIVGKFNDSFSIGPVVVVGNRLWGVVRKEVQIEFVVWKLELVDLLHAQVLIESNTSLWILDSTKCQYFKKEVRREVSSAYRNMV